jgi:hypothetical protein
LRLLVPLDQAQHHHSRKILHTKNLRHEAQGLSLRSDHYHLISKQTSLGAFLKAPPRLKSHKQHLKLLLPQGIIRLLLNSLSSLLVLGLVLVLLMLLLVLLIFLTYLGL